MFKNNKKCFLSLMLVFYFVIFFPGIIHGTWCLETVGGGEFQRGEDSSIVIDSNDHPRISFFEPSYDDLKYAEWDGEMWSVETVDFDGETGEYTSITVDSGDNTHISYYDRTESCLKHAYQNGTGWTIETVDSGDNVGFFSSMEIDADDHIHIAYWDATNNDLKYAFWNGVSWSIETVDSTDQVGMYSSLAVDSGNEPHISYYDTTNGDLKYAQYNTPSWTIEAVDSTGSVGAYTSLDVDSNDNAHISYLYNTGGDLKYAHWTGSAWEKEFVDQEGFVEKGYHSSMILDSNDLPHITYEDIVNHYLKYAHYNGVSWDIDTVNSPGDNGMHTSIALDSNDIPYISFFNTVVNDPICARFVYLVGGNISDSDALPIAGVNVTAIQDTAVFTSVVSDASGNYVFDDLYAGCTYTIIPGHQHYDFTPVDQVYASIGSEITDANFTGSAHIWNISGNIYESGVPLQGVTLSLKKDGSSETTTVTDASGNYIFESLDAGCTYTITPSKQHYQFSPGKRTYVDLSGDISSADFSGVLNQWFIWGSVREDGVTYLPGIAVSLKKDGVNFDSQFTNAVGSLLFESLDAGCTYTVIPSAQHYDFIPEERIYADLDQNIGDSHFNAVLHLWTISGEIDADSIPVSGATVSVVDGASCDTWTLTDDSGYYSFVDLPAGATYTITPTHSHCDFDTISRTCADLSNNETVNFTAQIHTWNISGNIRDNHGSQMAEVSISLLKDGIADTTTMTDLSGDYDFNGLTAGSTYSIIPNCTHYTFDPASVVIPDLSSDTDSINITGFLNKWSIGGVLSDSAESVKNVEITLFKDGTEHGVEISDQAGSYLFSDLDAGCTYSVIPSPEFYVFTPEFHLYNELSGNINDADFNGAKSWSSDLENLLVYPNPCNAGSPNSKISFNNLTEDSTIQIYNVSGYLVFDAVSEYKEYSWDFMSNNGDPVVAGIYFYVISNSAGEQKIGKLAIIK